MPVGGPINATPASSYQSPTVGQPGAAPSVGSGDAAQPGAPSVAAGSTPGAFPGQMPQGAYAAQMGNPNPSVPGAGVPGAPTDPTAAGPSAPFGQPQPGLAAQPGQPSYFGQAPADPNAQNPGVAGYPGQAPAGANGQVAASWTSGQVGQPYQLDDNGNPIYPPVNPNGAAPGFPYQQPQQPATDASKKKLYAIIAVAAVLVLIVVLIIVAALRGSSGGARNVSLFDFEEGYCFINEFSEEAQSSLPVTECSEPHNAEVTDVYEISESEIPTYTDIMVEMKADEVCYNAVFEYVGAGYDQFNVYPGYYMPSQDSWDNGDREILCYVETYDSSNSLTESLKGKG